MPERRANRIRPAWLVVGSMIAVAVLGFSAIQTVSVLAHEEETLETFVDDPIAVIDIANSAGSIEIVDADTDQVTVTAHISDGFAATHHSEEVDGDRLVLRASCPWLTIWCDVDYVVEAPSDAEVVARSGRGSITIDGITGSLDLAADHGGITVVDAAGTLSLSSDHGSIDVRDATSTVADASSDHGSVDLEFTRPPDSVRADTDHGNVTVRVPDGTDYNIGGATDIEVPTDPASDRVITVHSDHGRTRVVPSDR